MKYLLFVFFIYFTALSQNPMSLNKLRSIITDVADDSKVENNVLLFKIGQINMILITDSTYDRMRIMAPITQYIQIKKGQKDIMMQANFHAALDARYAVSNDVLYALFVHRLSSLSVADAKSAIQQVVHLAANFGGSYSSDALLFGQ